MCANKIATAAAQEIEMKGVEGLLCEARHATAAICVIAAQLAEHDDSITLTGEQLHALLSPINDALRHAAALLD